VLVNVTGDSVILCSGVPHDTRFCLVSAGISKALAPVLEVHVTGLSTHILDA
jgi:hypothetical protein